MTQSTLDFRQPDLTQPDLSQPDLTQPPHFTARLRFNGATYIQTVDSPRLARQIERVYDAMKDGRWRTLAEISEATADPRALRPGDPESSISAQLRHLRKERFGGYKVDKRSRGNRENGLWEYRLTN